MLSSLGMLRVLPEYLSLHHQLTEEIFGWDKDDDQWGEGCVVVAWGLQHWYIFLLTRKYSEIFDTFLQIESCENYDVDHQEVEDGDTIPQPVCFEKVKKKSYVI